VCAGHKPFLHGLQVEAREHLRARNAQELRQIVGGVQQSQSAVLHLESMRFLFARQLSAQQVVCSLENCTREVTDQHRDCWSTREKETHFHWRVLGCAARRERGAQSSPP